MSKLLPERRTGDSSAQRRAEPVIRRQLGKSLHMCLGSVPNLSPKVRLDGFHDDVTPTCVEIWAHQGKAKSAQRDKVMKDMCKLLLVEKLLGKKCRKIIAVCDKEARAFINPASWHGRFAEAFGIEVRVVDVPDATRRSIRVAQKRQYR